MNVDVQAARDEFGKTFGQQALQEATTPPKQEEKKTESPK
jgi:hypothetical protein